MRRWIAEADRSRLVRRGSRGSERGRHEQPRSKEHGPPPGVRSGAAPQFLIGFLRVDPAPHPARQQHRNRAQGRGTDEHVPRKHPGRKGGHVEGARAKDDERRLDRGGRPGAQPGTHRRVDPDDEQAEQQVDQDELDDLAVAARGRRVHVTRLQDALPRVGEDEVVDREIARREHRARGDPAHQHLADVDLGHKPPHSLGYSAIGQLRTQ